MKTFYLKFIIAIITFTLGVSSNILVQNLDLLVIPDKNAVRVQEIVETFD